jgi:tetratricopeptide (TPR) repeat protein
MRINKSIFILCLLIFGITYGQKNIGSNAKLFQRAKSLEQAGLNEEAIIIYQQLMETDSKNSQYYLSYKRFLRNSGNQEKILDIALNFYKHNPKDPSAHFEWVNALIMNQDENWEMEANIFIDNNYADKILMRQILFSMYSAGFSHQLNSFSKKMRELTKDDSFLARELGDIYLMRMDYPSGINEYLLFLKQNPHDFKYISDKVMSLPEDEYVVNIVRSELQKKSSNLAKLLLSNLEFREQNYLSAWNILKSQPNSGELQIEMGNDLVDNLEFDLAEKVFRDLLTTSKDKKIIEKCIFNIGRTLELKSIQNANKLPISGFFKGNPFFTPPFISINNTDNSLANAVAIFDSLSQNSSSKNNAQIRLADIKFRALGDLDGANNIFLNIFKSTKKTDIRKKCILRMIEIDIAKGNLISAKSKIEQFSDLFNNKSDQNKMRMKFAQILMFEGKKDSLNSFLRNSMKFMDSTDENFNDVLEILGLNLTFQKSNDIYSKFGKAQFLIQQNKRQEAIYTLEGLGEITDPLISELIQYQIIYLYLMQKDYLSAIELAFLLDGETIYSELAYILQCEIADYIQQDFRLAVDLYLEFLEKYPDSIYYDNIRLRLRELAS